MKPLIVLYGSQLGTAQSIAERIAKDASHREYSVVCAPLNDFEKICLPQDREHVLVIVTSTTGDGDPPDNALSFWKYLRQPSHAASHLSHLKYTVLALGDTNYENFCNMGKRTDVRLHELGAARFYRRALADDAVGLEDTVEPWIDGLWPVLETLFTTSTTTFTTCSGVSEQKAKSNTVLKEVIEATGHMHVSASVSSLDSMSMPQPRTKVIHRYQLHRTIHIPFIDLLSNTSALPRLPVPSHVIQHTHKFLDDIAPVLPPYFCREKANMSSENLQNSNALTENHSPHSFSPSACKDIPEPTYITPNQPFSAQIVRARCLTALESVKRTLEIWLDVKDANFRLVPGDAIGVLPCQSSALVDAICQRLQLQPNELIQIKREGVSFSSYRFPLDREITVRDLLCWYVDLTGIPKKSLFRYLSEVADNDEEKKTLLYVSSREGGEMFQYIRMQNPTLLDILNTFKSTKPQLDFLLEVLSPLPPRYYSVSNYSNENVRLVFNVIELPDPYHRDAFRYGVCTSWIDEVTGQLLSRNDNENDIQNYMANRMSSNIYVPVFHRSAMKDFRLLAGSHVPCVLIGPGTGVSPFIGYCEQKRAERWKMPLWLFYGCRHKDRDFLFQKSLEEFVDAGVLDRLIVSYSRDFDRENKKSVEKMAEYYGQYVQHTMAYYSEELCDLLLRQSARIYVCGDALSMAKEVHETLVSILKSELIDEETVRRLLLTWQEEKRYVRDIWT